MYEYCTSDELYHYGRKGMRWGQHIYGKVKAARTAKRRKAALVKARAAKNAKKVEADKRAALIKKGKIKAKDMTDAELNEWKKRLQLEKDYNDLVVQTKSAQQTRSKRFIEKFLDSTVDKCAENAGADIVAQAFKVLTAKGVNEVAKKMGSEGDVVFTNNKKK